MKPYHGQMDMMTDMDARLLLAKNGFGHLGCHHKDDLYVLPISYAFEEGFLYGHSRPGKKIEIMRKNSQVCVQVEQIENFFKWKSVIAWGTFEELKNDEAARGMRLIMEQAAEEGRFHVTSLEEDFSILLEKSVIFRINVQRVTGKSEG